MNELNKLTTIVFNLANQTVNGIADFTSIVLAHGIEINSRKEDAVRLVDLVTTLNKNELTVDEEYHIKNVNNPDKTLTYHDLFKLFSNKTAQTALS